MKRCRIISLYFFQKTCYHGNHIMHLVAPPKSKAIGLLKEQVGKIFSNSSITCYQEWSSKYVSLKKFFRADERRPTFPFLFNFFSHPQNFSKIGIEMYPINLICHQKFVKIHWPKAEIEMLVHEVGNGRLDPALRMCEVVHALNRVTARAKPPAFYPDVFSVKKKIFLNSLRLFYGLPEK